MICCYCCCETRFDVMASQPRVEGFSCWCVELATIDAEEEAARRHEHADEDYDLERADRRLDAARDEAA